MFPFKLAFPSYCCFSQKLPSPALMVCVVTSFCKFFFCFNIKNNLLGGKSFNQSLHYEFLVVKMFSSGTMKILLVYLKNLEIEYFDLQCWTPSIQMLRTLRVCKKSKKNNRKTLQSRVIR